MKRKIHYLTLFILASILAMPAHAGKPAPKDIFKSSEFLTWERDNQKLYINISIGMAILIADQNDKKHGQCLSDWFSQDEQAVYNHILETMHRFPTYHPRGTIAAVMEKKCGEFVYK